MGRALYEAEPVFRAAIDRAAAVLDPLLGRPLPALMGDAAALGRTEFAQPALVAYQTAMAALLADWGVVPEAVLGHSLGEYAAALVPGAAEPDPVLTLVAARGRMMQALQTGKALCRDRVCPYVSITVVAVSFTKTKT